MKRNQYKLGQIFWFVIKNLESEIRVYKNVNECEKQPYT